MTPERQTQFIPVKKVEEFNNIIQTEDAALFYFSHEACNVCKVLKPKLLDLILDEFPKIKTYYVDTQNYPDIAGQNSVFAVPTIIIFFDKNEYIRKSRNISIAVLKRELQRPYSAIFS